MPFRTAYDSRTGRKLPNPVPAHWFDHPVLGKNLRKTPRGERAVQRRTTQDAEEKGADKVE